jgi:uncharacterized protein (DUF4415 family)
MSKKSISRISDEYPEITQKDFDRAVFRVGLKAAPRKQRVSMMLDTAIIEWFKRRAGVRGYQTLINQTLKEVMGAVTLEVLVRRIVREELDRSKAA